MRVFRFVAALLALSCVVQVGNSHARETISAGTLDSIPSHVTIEVNASYSSGSLWTEEEIRSRFEDVARTYQTHCPGVSIVLREVVRIEDPDLQDIDGSLSVRGVQQMKRLLTKFQRNLRPTIFYVRKGSGVGNGAGAFTDYVAQAYTLDGPRWSTRLQGHKWNDVETEFNPELPFSEGILEWDRLEELRPLHGTAIIAQSQSIRYGSEGVRSVQEVVDVDRHELGHILLNDGSHRIKPRNLMAGMDPHRDTIDSDQCDVIRAYHTEERMRDAAVRSGIYRICSVYQREKVSPKPGFCRVR